MLWIRKCTHDFTSLRVAIPKVVVQARGWECERYIIVDDSDPDIVILRRLPSEEKSGGDHQGSLVRAD